MNPFRRHPSFRDLSDYVDRGEAAPDWLRLRAHLRDCVRCRDEVAWLRELSAAARSLYAVEPPPDALDRILERRAAGERVILPIAGPAVPAGASTSRPAWVLALVSGSVAALVLALVFVPDAGATRKSIRFDPPDPGPGQTVHVTYRPTVGLAGADSLRLRAAFRAAGQLPGESSPSTGRIAVTLTPTDGGTYEGRLRIPPIAAYGELVVEDPRGVTVDTDQGRPWPILTYRDGRVRYEALEQRLIASEHSDWRSALRTAIEMTERYPDRPAAWLNRLSVERRVVGPAFEDSLSSLHRDQLARLQALHARSDVEPTPAASLSEYAAALGDDEAAEFWLNRLARRAPRHPELVRLRAMQLMRSGSPPLDLLVSLEELWRESDSTAGEVAGLGFDLSVAAGQRELAARWAERWVAFDPETAGYVGRHLLTSDATLELGLAYLERARAQLLLGERSRPLVAESERWETELARRLEGVCIDLATGLLAAGRAVEAARLVRETAATASPDGALRLGELAAAAGDYATAARMLALTRADPLRSAERAERIERLADRVGFDPAEWRDSIAAFRANLRRAALRLSDYRVLSDAMVVETEAGEETPIRDLAAGRPTLVVYRALAAPAAVEASLEDLRRAHEAARDMSVTMVAVVGGWDGYRPDRSAYRDVPFPVLFDPGAGAAEAFRLWTARGYAVLDAEGILRGALPSLDAALRLIAHLPTGMPTT